MEPSSSLSGVELAFADFLARLENGEAVTIEDFCHERPGLAEGLRGLWSDWQHLESLRPRAAVLSPPSPSVLDAWRAHAKDVDLAALRAGGAALPADAPPGLPRRDGERYRPLGKIAEGGMGEIVQVWDEDLRRTLAMKIVKARGEGAPSGDTPKIDARTLGRFLEEAQITGQLDHPGIVPVHELGRSADGRPCFTMRLVRGVDLGRVIELVHAREDGWNPTRALGVLLKVCEAMSYAHDKGVIHRDLKPANVMVGGYGEVYVMDWGLARVLGKEDTHDLRIVPPSAPARSSIESDRREQRRETPGSPLLTRDGDVVGTPAYMPPEQARGDLDRLGPWSDVYSLGAMLYELLTGEAPFAPRDSRATPHAILGRLLDGPPRPVAELAPETPRELAAICAKAMARDPGERYPDMRALADDLRAFLEGRVVRAHASGAWTVTSKWVRRNRALAAALGATLLLAAGVFLAQHEVRAEKSRRAGMERQQRNELLVERLIGLHDDYSLGARDRQLDHAAHVERFLEEFQHAQLPLDGQETTELLAARLTSELGPQRIPVVLDGLYAVAFGLWNGRTIPAGDRAGVSPAPGESFPGPPWSRVMGLIDALDGDTWRKETWKAWTGSRLSETELPSSSLSTESTTGSTPRELEWLGELLWQSGRNEESAELFSRAIALAPDLFHAHFRLGNLHVRENGEDMALHHYRVAAALRPESSWARFNVGHACQERGEPYRQEAIREYRRAIELNPTMSDAHANLAVLLARREGLEWLREAWPRVDAGDIFLTNLEFLALECGEPDVCVAAARQGIQRFPANAMHHLHLGRGLEDLGGRSLEAAEAFTSAAERDPGMWLAWCNSAGCFLHAATAPPVDWRESAPLFEKALAAARRAYALDPGRIESTLNLAASLAGLERFEEALDLLGPALDAPADERVHDILDEIRDMAVEAGASDEVLAQMEFLLGEPEH